MEGEFRILFLSSAYRARSEDLCDEMGISKNLRLHCN